MSYPSLSLVGETSLSGLGLCSDRKGNVYAATGGYDVAPYHYPAGGSAYASYAFGTERSGFGATLSLAPKKK